MLWALTQSAPDLVYLACLCVIVPVLGQESDLPYRSAPTISAASAVGACRKRPTRRPCCVPLSRIAIADLALPEPVFHVVLDHYGKGPPTVVPVESGDRR
jgi:hypothetical protein